MYNIIICLFHRRRERRGDDIMFDLNEYYVYVMQNSELLIIRGKFKFK